MNIIPFVQSLSRNFTNRTCSFLIPAVLLTWASLGFAELDNYDSVWVKLYPATLEILSAPGDPPAVASPMFKDFLQAAASRNLNQAILRWKNFEEKYAPLDAGFGDSVHERYWNWARCESKRCRFLQAGDQTSALEVELALRAFGAAEEEGTPIVTPGDGGN